MARIELSWGQKCFLTDRSQCAEMFVRSPDSFIPGSSGVITMEVRTVLLQMLTEKPTSPTGTQKKVGDVTITLRKDFFSH